MPAPAAIRQLVERFEANLDTYRGGGYNETLLRRDFLDPFFKALGWDIDNSQDYAEAFREVIHEDAIKVGGSTKAPDYSFRIGGRRIFFLEAKKPSVYIKEEVAPAYQLRRYAWSAGLPLSILSDFEEFAVYDTRIKPAPADKPAKGRLLYLTFRDYLARWDEIAAVFSKEAVLKGSFDRYAREAKGKRGTATVDAEFLAQIEQWRDLLAKNLALRNPGIGVRDLNFAVQATIDRIVFLRICEDRGIEPLNRLQGLTNGPAIYPRLAQVFREADDRYNSGLFHFRSEKNRPGSPDEFTLGLKIDDKLLRDLLNGLYYPESPYEFSVLPADILGQVYERFLGSVIRLTAGGQAKVEEKPEVKKAGGVYYTPTYIVDYIVRQTVGRLLESQSPKDAAKLKILDPACGSGSFLIGAYQYLLDWHLKWYMANDPEKHAKGKDAKLYRAKEGWRLTAAERKRILVNNIYGVDIDAQAVEVTKLSLLLKVLEGETDESLNAQMKLFHERALPDLDGNIKCGNSLIGPDFFDGRLDLDEEERRRINAFDWPAEFPQVFPPLKKGGQGGFAGGFDAVIGNPPYVRPHNLEEIDKEYFWSRYKTFVKKSDLYCCFLERVVGLLKPKGQLGFIVSNGWLRLDSFEELRKFLLAETTISELVDFTGNVFDGATVKTAIVLLSAQKSTQSKIEVAVVAPGTDLSRLKFKRIDQSRFGRTYKHIFDLSSDPLLDAVKLKIESAPARIGDSYDISFGMKTGDDAKFLSMKKTCSLHKPVLRGENVHRYSSEFKGEYVRYVPQEMTTHRRTARPGSAERFEQSKVLVRDTGGKLEATYDDCNHYVKDVLIVSSRGKDETSLKIVLGLINSTLLRFYYETSFPTLHVQRSELASLPMPQSDVKRSGILHDKLVALVEQMLKLHRDLAAAKTAHDKTLLERQIAATDKQIDRLVYELYGLTEEEIAVVEGSGAAQ